MQHRNPILGYSKAPWGLSVLSRVTGIFTGTTISPGGLLKNSTVIFSSFLAGHGTDEASPCKWGLWGPFAGPSVWFLRFLFSTPTTPGGGARASSFFLFIKNCFFFKKFFGPVLCGPISGAPLLPKLRGQFAEFLNNPSPVGLRIFFLPTCVGLRYGHLRNPHSFSRHLPSQTSVLSSLDLYRNQHPALRLLMCPCA